jgi:DNA-binding NarL/FixJ family response regulator
VERLRFFAQRVLSADTAGDAEQYWRAFAAGGWRVVDHFDADGRRYVIARRGAGLGRELEHHERALLERRARGDSLKEIAADLGLSISAVSRRLNRVMTQLGIRSHAELPRLFSPRK